MQQHRPLNRPWQNWPRRSIACAIVTLLAATLSASPALAASPSAVTGGAQQVRFASATVTGTINPGGAATSYYFQYGTTSGYGLQTSAASAGAGSANVGVSQPLNGLAASTTYHYRVVATNASGTVAGHDATFATTATPAPAVSTGSASSVGSSSATLTGSLNPEGVATTYYFQYGSTSAYGSKSAVQSAGSGTSTQAVSAPVSGLAANTTYHYRLLASSSGGTVVGSDSTFTTSKTPAPLAVTGAATTVSTSSATVNGTVNPSGVATNYYFQYGTSAGYGHDTPTHSAGSGATAAPVSAAVSGLATGTTYHYRVVAVSSGGTVTGRDATFTTTKTLSPTVVTGAAGAVTATTANLTGTVDPHGLATKYYFLYGTRSPTTRTPTLSAGSGTSNVAVSATLSKLTPGTRYTYRLVATGARTANGSTRSFTTAKIAPLLSLTAMLNPISVGGSVTFTGALTGTGVGIRTVAIEVKPYPYTGAFTELGAPEQTSASGAFRFTLAGLRINTMVRAVTVGGSPSLSSAVTFERVRVRMNVHARRHGRAVRFSGIIAPGGAPVVIQIQRRIRGRWVTIVRTSTHPVSGQRSAFGRTISQPHRGSYRIVARVRDGSLLSTRSRVIQLR